MMKYNLKTKTAQRLLAAERHFTFNLVGYVCTPQRKDEKKI